MPNACIAADVIIGFPTETEDDFNETMMFINDIEISYIHAFTYSQRKDTYALKIKEQVSNTEKKRRSKELHLLSEKKKAVFYSNNKGSKHKVLFENSEAGNMISGWTDNYIKVYSKYDESLVNSIKEVKLIEEYLDGFLA